MLQPVSDWSQRSQPGFTSHKDIFGCNIIWCSPPYLYTRATLETNAAFGESTRGF